MLTVLSPRQWSNRELRRVLGHLPVPARVINVSGWLDADKEGATYRSYFRPSEAYAISNCSGDKVRGTTGAEGELCIDLGGPLAPELVRSFDVAFSHTVLEHILDPIVAFEQIAKLTTDLVVTVVPFKQKLHFEPGQYGDYHRFTPFAMRRMHERAGLTVLYESFTPPPSLDVYLFYLGTKRPEKHHRFPRHVPPIEELNFRVGKLSAADLARNISDRALRKFVRRPSFGRAGSR